MNQPDTAQKELERVNFFSSYVSEAESILVLDKIVQRLESSRTRSRLAEGGK